MTSTLSILSLEAQKLKIGNYTMWFKDNIIYCSDGTKTVQLNLNSFTVDAYDPTVNKNNLPYDNNDIIEYKSQTVSNALYEQLGQIIQNEKDIAEIRLELPGLEFDPLVDTAMLPYNNNGVAADKEQTIYQSLVNILNTALSSVGFYDPTKNTATLPYIENNASGTPTLYEKNQTVSDSLKNVMNRLIELILSGGTTYDPTINKNNLPYITANACAYKEQTVSQALENIISHLLDNFEFNSDSVGVLKNLTMDGKTIIGVKSPEDDVEELTRDITTSEVKDVVTLMSYEYYEAHKDELKGEKGDTGAQGPAGPQGPKGDNGLDGEDGEDGSEAVSWIWGLINAGATGATWASLQGQVSTLTTVVAACQAQLTAMAVNDLQQQVMQRAGEMIDDIQGTVGNTIWEKITNCIKSVKNTFNQGFQRLDNQVANNTANNLAQRQFTESLMEDASITPLALTRAEGDANGDGTGDGNVDVGEDTNDKLTFADDETYLDWLYELYPSFKEIVTHSSNVVVSNKIEYTEAQQMLYYLYLLLAQNNEEMYQKIPDINNVEYLRIKSELSDDFMTLTYNGFSMKDSQMNWSTSVSAGSIDIQDMNDNMPTIYKLHITPELITISDLNQTGPIIQLRASDGIKVNGTPVSLEGHTHSEYATKEEVAALEARIAALEAKLNTS